MLKQQLLQMIGTRCGRSAAQVDMALNKSNFDEFTTEVQIATLNQYFRDILGGGGDTKKARMALIETDDSMKWLTQFKNHVLSTLTSGQYLLKG